MSVTASVIALSSPVEAVAADYMQLNANKFVEGKGSNLGKVVVTEFIPPILNVLLTVGIIACIWRSIYYAIFCVIAHTDPLHLLNERNLTMIRSTTGTSAKARTQLRRQKALEDSSPAFGDFEAVEPEIGVAALKDELRKSVKALIVVGSTWTFLQVIVWGVSAALGYFKV